MATSLEEELSGAIQGFDALFSNDLDKAKEIFRSNPSSAIHMLGLGTTIFLQAALGMESVLVDEAVKALHAGEAAARAKVKSSKSAPSLTRFPPGTEWEILHADAIVLQGLTHALSETYYGYLQTLYALNTAHSKFMKLHKTIFPRGLDAHQASVDAATSSRAQALTASLERPASSSKQKQGFFGRLTEGSNATSSKAIVEGPPEGLLEEFIVNGAAFGFGLFNLVLSLLPAKARNVIGLFGLKAERSLSLQALSIAAEGLRDPYAVFSGGFLLRSVSWQANEAQIVGQYLSIVNRLEARYPKGVLWVLNRAKILHFTSRSDEAIQKIRETLAPASTTPLAGMNQNGITSISGSSGFVQADALLVFELALILLAEARYTEAADAFIKMTKLNTWSPATYIMFAVGCYLHLNQLNDAQRLIDHVSILLRQRPPPKRPGGGHPPTEVYISQRLTFWMEKQARAEKQGTRMVDVVVINPADELATLWNIHSKSSREVAIRKIKELEVILPRPLITSEHITASVGHGSAVSQQIDPSDTDFVKEVKYPEEYVSRSLLLGILHRTAGDYTASGLFFDEVLSKRSEVSGSWVLPVAVFEHATLELMKAEKFSGTTTGQGVNISADTKEKWRVALDMATSRLNQVGPLVAASSGLAGRIESRVNMLKDEIGYKRVALGLSS